MAPRTRAEYASLYEKVVDDKGDIYIAKLINGKMTWVLCPPTKCPDFPAVLLRVGDVMTGEDGQEYIVALVKGVETWVLHKPKASKKKLTSSTTKTPCTPASMYDVGDIQIGGDGNEYIVALVHGEKQYVLHQKSHKWSKTGVLYTTLTDENCGYSSSKSKSKSKMKTKTSMS